MTTMSALPTPWIRRYLGAIGRTKSIADQVRAKVTPLGSLAALSATSAAQDFEGAAKEIYLPSTEDCDTLARLREIAHSFAKRRFCSIERFRELRSMPLTWRPDPGPIVWFTGPAGWGRSTLLKQLPKVMPDPSDILLTIDERHSPETLPIRELNQVVIQARMRNAPIDELVQELSHGKFGKLRGADADRYLRKALVNSGASMTTADEFQSLTQGIDATDLIVQTIFRLSNLGVPLLVAPNYSLGWKMFERPKQDRDRILANPIVFGEREPDIEYIASYVRELVALAPKSFSFRPDDVAELIALRTFANRRAIVALLKAALQTTHPEKRAVTSDDLNAAYYSTLFASQREDVENRIKVLQGSVPRTQHKDLMCPFPLPPDDASDLRQLATEDREARVDEALHRARMSASERAEHDRHARNAAKTRPQVSIPTKGRPVTAAILVENARRRRESRLKKSHK